MLPCHTEGPLASLRAPGRPPKLATAPSHGLSCDPQTHTRYLGNKSAGAWAPFSLQPGNYPAHPEGPSPALAVPRKVQGQGGVPLHPAILSHPNSPLCLGSSAIFHSWWSSWRRRPRSCWRLGKWKDALERTRPVAKAHVGKVQPRKPEPEATSNPSLQGRKEQNRQPFLGPPAFPSVLLPRLWISVLCFLFPSPLSVCARTAQPRPVVKPGKSTTHVNV